MDKKMKGRGRHLVNGNVEQIKRGERVETVREVKQRQSILSRLISFFKGKKEDE